MICAATIFTTRRDMEALKILQELIESEFKAYPKHQRKDGQNIL